MPPDREAARQSDSAAYGPNNLQVWCRETGREDLLEEWAHPDKGPLEVTRGASEKVPWTCGKCGGTGEARIAQGLADIARHVIQRT